jgi:hypothetical protein
MRKREDSWFTLSSGRNFYPFSPREEDVFIEDIALALSHLCRYSGHCRFFYSVAEHSVHCSNYVAPGHELTALMHDATEAYVGDLIRPIKVYMPDFVEMEDNVWRVIARRFGLPEKMPLAVHDVDNTILVTEARDLLPDGADLMKKWGIPFDPISSLDVCRNGRKPWSPEEAERQFLLRFRELYEAANPGDNR